MSTNTANLNNQPTVRRVVARITKGIIGQERFDQYRNNRALINEGRQLHKSRLEHVVEVREPLLLISQIQRSGGTLLSQLFDGHPQCHAHPSELKVGYPVKENWPHLNLNSRPEDWFDTLFESISNEFFVEGYSKYSKGAAEIDPKTGLRVVNRSNYNVHPFLFLSSLQKAVFLKCVERRGVKSERDIFDFYMTSYFNAWLDNQNLYSTPKKFVTAFTARLSMQSENLDKFFAVYPDGRLVSLVRDPRSWFLSARRHSQEEYGNIEEAIRLWNLSTSSAINARAKFGDRIYIMSFEELVEDTEAAVRRLADYMEIDFSPELTFPTFNGFPIKADSSFAVKNYGVLKEPIQRYKELLTSDEITYINNQALGLYEEALALKVPV